MGAFLFVTTGGVGIDSGISCMETWDAAEHLVMHRTVCPAHLHVRNYLVQNVSTAEVVKPCSNLMILPFGIYL